MKGENINATITTNIINLPNTTKRNLIRLCIPFICVVVIFSLNDLTSSNFILHSSASDTGGQQQAPQGQQQAPQAPQGQQQAPQAPQGQPQPGVPVQPQVLIPPQGQQQAPQGQQQGQQQGQPQPGVPVQPQVLTPQQVAAQQAIEQWAFNVVKKPPGVLFLEGIYTADDVAAERQRFVKHVVQTVTVLPPAAAELPNILDMLNFIRKIKSAQLDSHRDGENFSIAQSMYSCPFELSNALSQGLRPDAQNLDTMEKLENYENLLLNNVVPPLTSDVEWMLSLRKGDVCTSQQQNFANDFFPTVQDHLLNFRDYANYVTEEVAHFHAKGYRGVYFDQMVKEIEYEGLKMVGRPFPTESPQFPNKEYCDAMSFIFIILGAGKFADGTLRMLNSLRGQAKLTQLETAENRLIGAIALNDQAITNNAYNLDVCKVNVAYYQDQARLLTDVALQQSNNLHLTNAMKLLTDLQTKQEKLRIVQRKSSAARGLQKFARLLISEAELGESLQNYDLEFSRFFNLLGHLERGDTTKLLPTGACEAIGMQGLKFLRKKAMVTKMENKVTEPVLVDQDVERKLFCGILDKCADELVTLGTFSKNEIKDLKETSWFKAEKTTVLTDVDKVAHTQLQNFFRAIKNNDPVKQKEFEKSFNEYRTKQEINPKITGFMLNLFGDYTNNGRVNDKVKAMRDRTLNDIAKGNAPAETTELAKGIFATYTFMVLFTVPLVLHMMIMAANLFSTPKAKPKTASMLSELEDAEESSDEEATNEEATNEEEEEGIKGQLQERMPTAIRAAA